VNGDGYADVIVGAPSYSNGQTSEGRAYLYLGGPSGLALSPAWVQERNQANAQFGHSVAGVGDVNGDGYDDVVIGADGYSDGQASEGGAFLYLGGPSGLSTTPAWIGEANQAGASYGWAVAPAGDVNGDGYADVVVSAYAYNAGLPGEGRVLVYYGGPGGLSTLPNWTKDGDQQGGRFGYSISTAGDVNGDGYADLIVGYPYYTGALNQQGRALVFFGSSSGLNTTAGWVIQANQANSGFGISVATAGDIGGDGFADVIVGADEYDNGEGDEGAAWVWEGSRGGLPLTPSWFFDSNQVAALAGLCVATAGDVNSDGHSEVLVSAPFYDNGQTDEGAVFLFTGTGSLPTASADWVGGSNQAGARYGTDLSAAGDVNGDGYGDMIVGVAGFNGGTGRAALYEGAATGFGSVGTWVADGDQAGGAFGACAVSAGDVNGDGYDDLLVGAPLDGASGEGRALLYLGTPTVPSSSPAWTANGSIAGDSLGYAAASGDVNGDGYSDVIVLSKHGGPGRAALYLGSPAGLTLSPAWTFVGTQPTEGGGGITVGDYNGDGYSDVAIGFPGYQITPGRPVGEVRIFKGGPSGLSATPWGTISGAMTAMKSGHTVSSGDANGDGYSDLLIGAPGFQGSEPAEGAVFLYPGGPSGLTSSSWSASSALANAAMETGGTWGDVNGDGYDDLLVCAQGASDVGEIYVYLGSASGPPVDPDWTQTGAQAQARFGHRAISAIDANGDGVSDVVASADLFDGGGADQGRAFLFYGDSWNSGAAGLGLDRIPEQFRASDAAPIAFLGRSDAQTGFRARALGRNAAGRARVRLQIEAKPLGILFNGAGLITGSTHDTGAPISGVGSAVPIDEAVSSLAAGTAHHWRLRAASSSPFFPRTPWISIQGNGPNEMKLRTAPAESNAGDVADAPASLRIESTHPNPTRRGSVLAYSIPRAGHVHVEIFDASGRRVAALVDRVEDPGRHAVTWNGRDCAGARVPSGVYLARLTEERTEVGAEARTDARAKAQTAKIVVME
jgi:hypothetical protein